MLFPSDLMEMSSRGQKYLDTNTVDSMPDPLDPSGPWSTTHEWTRELRGEAFNHSDPTVSNRLFPYPNWQAIVGRLRFMLRRLPLPRPAGPIPSVVIVWSREPALGNKRRAFFLVWWVMET